MIRYDEALGKWVFDHDGKTYALPARWEGVLAIEKQVTGDGRMLEADSLRWDLEDSIPLRAVMSDIGMHGNAEVIGRIESISRDKDLSIKGAGTFDLGSEVGREAARLVATQFKRGVSVDLDEMTFEIRVARELLEDEIEDMEKVEALWDEDADFVEIAKKQLDEMEEDEDGRLTVLGPIEPTQEIMVTLDARIRAATLVDVPAFSGASINAIGADEISGSNVNDEPEEKEEVKEEDAVTAAVEVVDGEPDRTIPEDVQFEAEQGLDMLKANSSRDIDERAVEVSNILLDGGEAQDDLIREMLGFFEENQEVRDEEGFNDGEEGFPSNGRITWQLWGGDTGWDWAAEVVAVAENIEEREEIDEEIDDGDTDLSEGTPVEVSVAASVVAASGIAAHSTDTSSAEWDGPENVKRLANDADEGYYAEAYAWRDDDKAGDSKNDYKFIHHEVADGGAIGAANTRACQTGIGVLNGARGGTTIPDADREAVYAHLAKHLEDADIEPPALSDDPDAEADATVASASQEEPCTDCASPSYSLVAAAPAVVTEPNVFDNPHLPGPTPLTITKQGRIFGHLALWDTCHIGMSGACVTPPRSTADYAYFHTGAVTVNESQVPVGQITLGGGHADMKANANAAVAHYDETGTAVADIVAGEDEFGIWFSGQLREGITPAQVEELRAGTISGDWRAIGGNLELVAALAVNVPGFPVPRARAHMVASGQQSALVAAGVPAPVSEEERSNMKMEALVASALDRRERVAAAAKRVEEGVAKTLKMRYDSASKRLAGK